MEIRISLFIVSAIGLIVYIRYAILFLKGIKNKQEDRSFDRKKISIIVAARNEEKNIRSLLISLVNQSYSEELTEIIIADDQSTDRTADIVKEFSNKWQNLKLIYVKDRDSVISAKKNALAQAINIANGEIILLTDADCIPGKNWAEAMVAHFTEKISMVVGFSKTRILNWEKAKLSEKFEHFDFLAMFFAAAGGIVQHRYFSCSGQNLAYRKSAFEKVGGFSSISHLISGDDVNLMQLMQKAGMNIRFSFSSASYMTTISVNSWKQLLNQRSRWASNMKYQLTINREFFFYLVAVLIVTYLPIIMLFFQPWIALSMLLIKYFIEFCLIKEGFEKFKLKKNRLNFYPVWVILQPVYMLIVAILGLLSLFKWKK